jgi:hypothetical protein
MVVTTWDALADAATGPAIAPALREFVRKGGVLLVAAAASGLAGGGTWPAWLGAAPGGEQRSTEGTPLLVFDRAAALWDEMRDERGDVLLRRVKTFRFHALAPAADATGLMGLEDGTVVLAQRREERGTVFCSGIAFDTRASTLPLRAAFLALAQGMALSSPGTAAATRPVVAGTKPAFPVTADTAGTIRSVAGSPMEWQGRLGEAPVLARCGVYRVEYADESLYLAVRAADREGYPQFVEQDSLPALGTMPHTVWECRDIRALRERVRRGRVGVNLFPLCLLLALAAALAEGWLVNPAPRRPQRGSARPAAQPVTTRDER